MARSCPLRPPASRTPRRRVRWVAMLLLAAAPTPGAAAPLDFESFFSGRLAGSGTVVNTREGTRRPFTATIVARWTGPHGTVTEDLAYADGETKRLAWTFDRAGPDHWTGHRDDLVGTADVRREGETLRMTYKARTRVPSGSTWTLSFDDRFTRTGNGQVALQGEVSYLFFGVGSTAMAITKTGP